MAMPEARAREQIDAALEAAGWRVQDAGAVNLHAAPGVAVREFPLKTGHGFADYLLFADGRAVGVVEAKKAGTPLIGVEPQSARYSAGLPDMLSAPVRPLPFLYESTGVETRFTNGLDPEPRSRPVFAFHRPATLAGWLTLPAGGLGEEAEEYEYDAGTGRALRRKLRQLPPLAEGALWPAQIQAVRNLEASLAADRPRALAQMATGSGKTFTAITSIYRLIKHGGARRVLFLVDRGNLGRQALKEFQHYTTPDDGRVFTELYNVQHLTSNTLDPVALVVITTIQRLYSMLRGDAELDPALEEGSLYDGAGGLLSPFGKEPAPLGYNPRIPIETFDIVFTDECHRSIYNLWRQVLEYFDAYLIGLTATPSQQTYGFFNQNLVMEYNHEQAVADGVNVDYDVYRIRTRISEGGATVEAGLVLDKRDRLTRAKRWETLDEPFTYAANALDRDVVALDQIRTVVRAYRDKLFTEIFPGRTDVPKTLIYAKDDSHADDITQIVREEFGKGNEFCQKITYRTTGAKPEELLASFRNAYNPRIVVTVDMIATGTDIKPLEAVVFMRAVRSRNFFEQMKGRGVRVINDTDFQAVTPDARSKTRFVLVDCVGVTDADQPFTDSPSLERKRGVGLDTLLNSVGFGSLDADVLSSLAGRLARLDRQLGPAERAALTSAASGLTPSDLAHALVAALDPDAQRAAAQAAHGLPPETEPTPAQLAGAAETLLRAAAKPLAANPELRQLLVAMQQRFEQTIDTVSKDAVTEAGYSAAALERARALTRDFEAYLDEHRDQIAAFQVQYNRPYAQRLRPADIRALLDNISAPPRSWTTAQLWHAYETLDKSRVRGAPGTALTSVVSLVRYAIHAEDELAPFPERVAERFERWLAEQESRGRAFTPEQRGWLEAIRDHVAGNAAIERADFEEAPFNQRGGLGRVYQLFGPALDPLLEELNAALVA